MHACVCVLSVQRSLCCSKRASAVSDGGDSLEATHQGDAIACVCACLCAYESASVFVCESDVIICVFAAAYTLRS